MRTITTTLYSFDELSERAKKKAIEDWREGETFDFVYDNAGETLKQFAAAFQIDIRSYSFDEHYRNSYSFDYSEDILALTGHRLATFLWNNHKDNIWKAKYYHTEKFGLTDKRIIHKRVKSKLITNECPNKGKWSNSYYSAITLERGQCPFTGWCYDEDVLDPINKFIDNPDGRTFQDLLEECLVSLNKSVQGEIEGCSEDDYIAETLVVNEYEFTADGTMQ